MKQDETNKTANQLLQDFDALKPIEPSNDWEQKLFLKLSKADPVRRTNLNGLKAVVIIIIFLIINGLAFFQSNRARPVSTSERHELLQNISDQLLISSTASN